MEGLQGWMAEIERKQERMTYFGGGAAVARGAAARPARWRSGIINKQDSAPRTTSTSSTSR